MSWYVLYCKPGQEQAMIRSCKRHLSSPALEDAFVFQCQRLWKAVGQWKCVRKDMFPGYVFLQSRHPKLLSEELNEYRKMVTVLEDKRYLISVYEEEEEALQRLCGNTHCLGLSYGYKDKEIGSTHFINGPLKDLQENILKIDWHKRYAQVRVPLFGKKAVVWAGIDIQVTPTNTFYQ